MGEADTKVSAVTATGNPTFTDPATDLVAATKAAYVAKQAAVTTITGSIKFSAANREECGKIAATTAITALKADLVTLADSVAAQTTVMVACDDMKTTMSYSIHVKVNDVKTETMIMNKLLAYGTTKWKTFVTTALGKATPTVTPTTSAFEITDPTSAATTTTSTTSSGSTATTKYVAMTKLTGSLTGAGATKSDCLNMQDPKGKLRWRHTS